MRAVRFETGGEVALVDLPTPEPAKGEALVRVRAAGVCRTDVHLWHEVASGARGPLVPGHEIAGTVEALGPGAHRLRVGDPVVVHFEIPCGRCRACVRKRTNLCDQGASLGFSLPGGYAEFVHAPEDSILAAPRALAPEAAATLGCSGATAHHAVVTLGGADERDLVAVVGAGGVGLSAVQVAKARGATVVVVDVRPEARDAAKACGADAAAGPEDALAAILAASRDRGADLVVDFVSTADSMRLGLAALAPGGRLVVLGPSAEPVAVSPDLLTDREISVIGARSSTMADLARAVDLAEGRLLRPVVTRTATLAEAESVLRDLEAGRIVGRAVLLP